MKPDLGKLITLTEDLECGHPIEAILRQHGIHERWSACEVVMRQAKSREYAATAVSDYYRQFWKDAVAELEPCIKAIALYFEEGNYVP